MIEIITPQWPAPLQVKAFTTTRKGGFSQAEFSSLNLADDKGDEKTAVARNRALLREQLLMPAEPLWLTQVHGTTVVPAEQHEPGVTADAAYTRKTNVVCAVTTADCLPLLICDKAGTCVAAVHAGWKGLAAGVIEATLKTLQIPGNQLLVWLGPAMGPQAFEVREDVLQQFVAADPQAIQAFKPISADQWLVDIYLLAKQRLANYNVTAVYGGKYCTYTDAKRFYSFRRDNKTGRMASLIWLQK
jgi:YfiH family protein